MNEPFLIRASRYAMAFLAGMAFNHIALTFGGF
jgi:hypothetical protein